MVYQEAEGDELLEFNKELQWTLMMMKKDNDTMRDSLEYLMQGGDPKKLEEEQMEKLIGQSPDKFKTPHVDNVFEMHSEFQSASAGIKEFNPNEEADLRKSKPEESPERPSDLVPTKEDGSKAPAAPMTPPKKREQDPSKFDVKGLVETVKKTHKDSYEKQVEQPEDNLSAAKKNALSLAQKGVQAQKDKESQNGETSEKGVED